MKLSEIYKSEALYNFLFINPLYSKIDVENELIIENYQENIEREDFLDFIGWTIFKESKDISFLKKLILNKFSIYGLCPECNKSVYLTSEEVASSIELESDDILSEMANIRSEEEHNECYYSAKDKFNKKHKVFVEEHLTSRHFFSRVFTCESPKKHKIKVDFRYDMGNQTLIKVGQSPSIYEFENNIRTYRKDLSKKDYSELNKAIGLKTHGNGIGAFVYLRRIFERLLNDRLKDTLGDEEYVKCSGLSTEKKIKKIKDELPQFLVDNKQLYDILSKGIHELEESTCLKNFETVKSAIVVILEEDARIKRNESLKKELSVDLSNINTIINS